MIEEIATTNWMVRRELNGQNLSRWKLIQVSTHISLEFGDFGLIEFYHALGHITEANIKGHIATNRFTIQSAIQGFWSITMNAPSGAKLMLPSEEIEPLKALIGVMVEDRNWD